MGFTLIELMITVAIVGLLASLAYPAYSNSVLKGRRTEARVALMTLMQAQERYLTQFNSYLAFSAGATGSTGTTATGTGVSIPFRTMSGDNDRSASYRLSAAACAGAGGAAIPLSQCVVVSAEPLGADPVAGTLTLTSTGIKGCTGSGRNTAGVCW